MTTNKNLLCSILLSCSLIPNVIAQKIDRPTTGEVVMTQKELDDFLAKIAEMKRQQMLKRQSEIKINSELNAMAKNNSESVEVTTQQPNTLYNQDYMLMREFDRINSRIDLLMLNSGNNGGNMQVAPPNSTTTHLVPAPTNAYINPYSQPIVPNNVVPNNSALVTNNYDADLDRLNRENAALREELRVLGMVQILNTMRKLRL
jgi:hypothetical protein